MKTKLPLIAIAAILVSACTTGTYMTKSYDDDIYFSPADVPPATMVDNQAPAAERPVKKSISDTGKQKIVISQMEKNEDGTSTLNNYVYQSDQKNNNQDYQNYDMDNQDLVQSDTTVYYNDDDVKYVINNYYDDNDIDFAYRIGRFHRPWHYYSPFFYDNWYYGYNSWYSGYYGWDCGWGYDPWYSCSWGYPYSYYGYYSPFYFGFGGYWGGWYGGYNHGYYDGYYGGGYYGDGSWDNHHRNRDNVRYGRSSDFSNYAGGGGGSINRNSSGSSVGRSVLTGKNGSLNQGSTRISRSVDGSNTMGTRSAVQGARNDSRVSGRQVSGATGSVRRMYAPSTTGSTYNQSQTGRQSNYTPSYNKPRVISQSSYNNNSYSRPRTSEGSEKVYIKSANTGNSYNSTPRSSSSVRQTYRSSSSYSSGSSSSSTRNSGSYSSPSRGSSSYSSGSSYSAPSRSYGGGSGGSSSSGGSNPSGGSGGRSGSGGRR